MNKTVDLQLCNDNVYDNCLACFHVGSGVGKPGCYVAAMMTWLWTDVRHTYNTNCNSTARTVEGLVLNRKIVGYATRSRHERRQHFGDYHGKKEGDGEAGGGWVSGGMWEPLASVKGCRWHHCTWTRMRSKSEVSQKPKRGTLCDPHPLWYKSLLEKAEKG